MNAVVKINLSIDSPFVHSENFEPEINHSSIPSASNQYKIL